MIFETLRRWPVVRQMLDGGDGTGREAMSDRTRALGSRTAGAEVTPSICPYCAVGCGPAHLSSRWDETLVKYPAPSADRFHWWAAGSASADDVRVALKLEPVESRRGLEAAGDRRSRLGERAPVRGIVD